MLGKAGPGKARQGRALLGKEHGAARHGLARQGFSIEDNMKPELIFQTLAITLWLLGLIALALVVTSVILGITT